VPAVLVEILLGGATLTSLVAGGLAWYHGSQARGLRERTQAAEAAVTALRSVNTELRASLSRALAKVAARAKQEKLADEETAADAVSPGAAAGLLNGLRGGRTGPDKP
jgi:hypothetical protein